MKNQAKGQLVLGIASLFFALLVVGIAIAQTAPSPQGGGGNQQWVSPSAGITVTMNNVNPSQNTNTVVFKYEGTGKNGAPKGVGKTGSINLPTSCPRNKEGHLYSETHDIANSDGTVIAKLKIVFNVDCSIQSMSIIDGEERYSLTPKKK